MDAVSNNRASRFAIIFILSIFAVFALLPFYFLLVSAFKPGVEMIRHGITLNPHFEKFTLNQFKLLFDPKESNYFYWYRNSLLYTGVQTVMSLVLTSMVGYGLGVYTRYKYRNAVFVMVLLVMMIPVEIMILPLYKEMVYSLQDDARSKPISKKVIDNPLITSIYNSLDTAGYLI